MSLQVLFTTRQQLAVGDKTCSLQQEQQPTTTKNDDDNTKQQQQQKPSSTNDEEEVEDYLHHTKNLPLIHRNNVRIGSRLGKGSFSKVYKIKNRIRLDTILSSSSSSSSSSTKKNSSPSIKKKQVGNSSSSSSLLASFSSLVVLSLSKNNNSNNQNKKKDKKKYAMKILRNTIMRKEEKYVLDAKEDMKKEIQALSILNHVNINQIYGYGFCSSPDNTPFLIIEQIEYTLHERMQDWQYLHENHLHYYNYYSTTIQNNNSLGFGEDFFVSVEDDDGGGNKNKHYSWLLLKEKINIGLQILNALQYMHDHHAIDSNGFVYRDLKPQNTGLQHSHDETRATKVKLFDFGTCRKLPATINNTNNDHSADGDDNCCKNKEEEEYYNMTIVGSPRYMAPEIHGHKKYNAKVDVYSWSIVFFEMLTLHKAYPTYTPKQYHKKIYRNKERPQFVVDDKNDPNYIADPMSYDLSVPKEIQTILQNSWEGDVSKRYSSKNAQEELQSFCDEHSIVFPKEEEEEDKEEEDITMDDTMNTVESSSNIFSYK